MKNKYAGMSANERFITHTMDVLGRKSNAEIMRLSPGAYAYDTCGSGKIQWLYDTVADCVRKEQAARAQAIRQSMTA